MVFREIVNTQNENETNTSDQPITDAFKFGPDPYLINRKVKMDERFDFVVNLKLDDLLLLIFVSSTMMRSITQFTQD